MTAAAAAVVQDAGAKLLGWPGAVESIQDLLTQQFRQPDVPHPVLQWLRADAQFLAAWSDAQRRSPLTLVVWGVAP
ncbi:hypothetical protein AB0368_03135 [Actinoplanes sp. NPDC051475]|uniref:hypothetical protein n=1 Tax=Actinoplanes sp. NPDC051475 TaxID=3157225 RepID=UPI00344E11D8